MDLENIMLSEISQTGNDKHCMLITYMWNLKNKLKEGTYIKKMKQTHRYKDRTGGYQWGEEMREG